MVSTLLLVAALSVLYFSYSHAFLPSPHAQRSISSLCSMVMDERSQPRSSSSSSNSDERSPSLNMRLDQLAQRCADPKEHVVLLASQCEDLFQQSMNEADTVSFNIHLKAWKNTCATLAENKHKQNTAFAGQHQPHEKWETIPSVPVYTARDAVQRATSILLEMEQTHQENPHSSIVPDCASYNVVIGTYNHTSRFVCICLL